MPASPAHGPANRRGGAHQAAESNGPSRNAPCYCGSGKKYKRCHGAPGAV
ncbi:SEC-C metal-binding domain-containing protein [Actinoplanes sp. CA-030573]